VYYYYGQNVYYEGGDVYYGDEVYCSAEEYAQQADAIVQSAPEVDPAKADWMPLGVFALTADGQDSGPPPTTFMQLSVSKEGVIVGTLHNEATGSTAELDGMVDKKTQRAAWTRKDQSRPLIETGIHNLTQDTAPVLIHFADGQTQQALLVRLPDPDASGE